MALADDFVDLSSLPQRRLLRDEAIAVASGAAASAFELIATWREPMGDQSLDGRYWYGGGRAGRGDEARTITEMVGFVLGHPDDPPESLYRFVAGDHVMLDPAGWAGLPLCMTVAYQIFHRLMPELVGVAERQAAAREMASAPPRPLLPDDGVWRRTTRKAPSGFERVVLSHKKGPKTSQGASKPKPKTRRSNGRAGRRAGGAGK